MIVTEEEALTKRCQETFLLLADDKGDCSIEWHHCIGSACMAWRRAPHHMQYDANVKQDPTNGYCGKAGKP